MIAKITRGSRVAGLAAYLHGPGRANEHVYGGRVGGAVIGGTLGADGARDGQGWAADMQAAIDGRPEVVGPVWHMSLRCAPGDRTLSDAQWRHAAQTMGERMGWADRPWVLVRHGEDHVHVVVSRVGWDQSLWHGRNDRHAAQAARRVVERELGLTQAPVARDSGPSLTSGEQSRALRTGVTPPREELAARVMACAGAARGLGRETFEDALTAQGVAFRANVASTGRVSGYSFALPEHTDAAGEVVWWKASRLDKALSWRALSAVLDAPLPEPVVSVEPKKLLERRGTYEQRAREAQERATAADRAARRHWAPSRAAQADQGGPGRRASAWRTRQASSERTQIVKKRDALRRFTHRAPAVGDLPVSRIDLEALEARALSAVAFPHPPGYRGPGHVPAAAASSGTPYVDRTWTQDHDRGRGLGR